MGGVLEEVFKAFQTVEKLNIRSVPLGSQAVTHLDTDVIAIGVSQPDPQNGILVVPSLTGPYAGFRCLSELAASPEMAPLLPPSGDAASLVSRLNSGALVVQDDATPDRLLAFVILAIRLLSNQVPPELQPWIEAVSRHRRDGNVTGDPMRNWCALQSAGSHAIFTRASSAQSGDGAPAKEDQWIDPQSLSNAWTSGVQFLTDALRQGCLVDRLPESPSLHHQQAFQSALEREQDIYQAWLEHANIVQLRLPLLGHDGKPGERVRIADALIYEEEEEAGAAKLFYRKDTENSPMKRGFDVAVAYRPNATPGNRFTLSSDPDSGICLKPIYDAIESAESDAWKAASVTRPSDAPRRLPGLDPAVWNEPWYQDGGRYTLIASPRGFETGQGLPEIASRGSFLDWEDIQRIVWETSNPLKEIRVVQTHGPAEKAVLEKRSLWDVVQEPKPVTSGDKRLVNLRWAQGSPDDSRAMSLPSVEGAMASIPRQGDIPHGTFSLIYDPMSYDRINVKGGFVIVTEDGAVLFDDWRPWMLDSSQLVAQFEACAAKDAALKTAYLELANLQERFATLMDPPSNKSGKNRGRWRGPNRRKLEGLLKRTVALQMLLKRVDRTFEARIAESGVSATSNPSLQNWREALDKRWGLTERSERYSNLTELMLSSIEKTLEIGARAFQRLIFLLGFAITPSVVVSEPLGRMVAPMMPPAPERLGRFGDYLTKHAVDGWQVLLSVLLSGVLFMLLHVASTAMERRTLSSRMLVDEGD